MSFWSTGDREEEEKAGRIHQGGRRRPWRNPVVLLDRLTGDVRNVASGNPEVVELAVGEAAQLVNRLPVAAPVAVIADQVHDSALSGRLDVSFVATDR